MKPVFKNIGRAWGILVLAGLFGVGGYFLFKRSLVDAVYLIQVYPFSPVLIYGLYGLLAVVGLGKGEFIFRRKFLARALMRARDAIGEWGFIDVLLAPFCMLSMYRPWIAAHALASWVLIPLMVGLAVLFRFGLPDLLGEEYGTLLRGPVYFGIGLALAYGCAIYLVALVKFIIWWIGDRSGETMPLPTRETPAEDPPVGLDSPESE